MDELRPHHASFHPSILQTYTCTFIYFCSALLRFQFAMARGAHPHPRCVLLGRPAQNFPLLRALISVLSSGNSQLAWLWINGFTQKGCGDTGDRPKGVCFPEPHVSPPQLSGSDIIPQPLGGLFLRAPGFPGSLKQFDLYKESEGPLVVALGVYFWCMF